MEASISRCRIRYLMAALLIVVPSLGAAPYPYGMWAALIGRDLMGRLHNRWPMA
jgi:hypothetical protein